MSPEVYTELIEVLFEGSPRLNKLSQWGSRTATTYQ